MGNKITEKYFDHVHTADDAQHVLDEIAVQTQFQPEKEIFRGTIYDKDKVGSLIYKGIWQGKPAVLKIQLLQPDVDEIELIERFNKQNKSKIVRLPQLYQGERWSKQSGYGYLLLEYVSAPRIYEPPFATAEQRGEFCALYQEYKTNCLREPLVAQEPNEHSSLVFTSQRVSHWVKIAQAKGDLHEATVKHVETFLSLAGRHLPSIQMECMHGHFTYDDIFQVSDSEYVLMSNLFWSYRPEYYDATFHLWAGIKSIRDKHVTIDHVTTYLQEWIDEYKKLSVVAADPDFERKFTIMLTERCVGALLVDIQNQYYKNDREQYVAHLINLFETLFQYCVKKLETTNIP